jgi:hypothetical protein
MSNAPQPVPVGQPLSGYTPQNAAMVYQVPPGSAAPAPQQPVPVQEQPPAHHKETEPLELRVYSHSTFFYWWPVWLTGYIMALVTRVDGNLVDINGSQVWMHHSKNLGVIFTLTFFLVILITNVTLRGMASVVAILAAGFTVLLLAYFGWWEDVLNWMGRVSIYMNMGFYIFFSSLVLFVWAVSVFVYDRMTYWRVTPGQLTEDHVVGGAQKSYDTRGMVFEKQRQDLFRHWVLGLGSGDVQISTTGARRETFLIPNVLFVDSKVAAIQKMIAMQPDQVAPS